MRFRLYLVLFTSDQEDSNDGDVSVCEEVGDRTSTAARTDYSATATYTEPNLGHAWR